MRRLRDLLDIELERIVVVNRLSDIRHLHSQVNTSHVCSTCRQPVGIYRAGQDALRQYRRVQIVCYRCRSNSLNSAAPRGK